MFPRTRRLDGAESVERLPSSQKCVFHEGEDDAAGHENVRRLMGLPTQPFFGDSREIPLEKHSNTRDESLQNSMDNYQISMDTRLLWDADGRRECLQKMMRIAEENAVIPRSLYCSGVQVYDWQLRGEGAFAYVYRDFYDGKAVAVKVSKQVIGKRRETWKQWIQTALLWRQLAHPNILQCYGVNNELQIDRYSCISMVFPWIPNGDLRHFIEDKVPFRDKDTFPLNSLKDVARGLQYLHEHNPPIVHADIRGASVLVKQDMTCCISGFELSFCTEFTLTSHGGDVPGTIRFMAPEVLSPPHDENFEDLGREIYDTPARDTYAFGCMIVEVYTAQDPFFWLRTSAQVTRAVCAQLSEPWRTKPTGITEALWKIARSCWRADPKARPRIESVYNSLCSITE
ncbi:kinase-like protein, partial [Cylindrobasidium torrendii FP15055 ss-10]